MNLDKKIIDNFVNINIKLNSCIIYFTILIYNKNKVFNYFSMFFVKIYMEPNPIKKF